MCNYCIIYIISWSIFRVHVPFPLELCFSPFAKKISYYKALAAFKVACASGFGAPHSGHVTFDPNTKRRWFAQLEFGHCQSPSRVEATLSMTQTSNFEPKTTDAGISGGPTTGEWGNIPIPTLHEIWFSSSFWVDFCFIKKTSLARDLANIQLEFEVYRPEVFPLKHGETPHPTPALEAFGMEPKKFEDWKEMDSIQSQPQANANF